MPMYLGSTPATAHATSRPIGLRPCALANSSLAITVAAAPSTIPEAFPAVTSPSFLKYGLRPISTCSVVSSRTSRRTDRSEEHTSELQSHHDLVCRLLLEKKKKNTHNEI